jgi:hypothetical protein
MKVSEWKKKIGGRLSIHLLSASSYRNKVYKRMDERTFAYMNMIYLSYESIRTIVMVNV